MQEFLKNNIKYLIVLVLLVGAFAAGRYTSPTKIETKIQTVEVEKIKKNEDTVIVEKITPDGTKTTQTHIVSTTEENNHIKENFDTVTESKHPATTISLLGGLDINNSVHPVYGLSASRNILGPISMGIFGLSNGTVGLSVGLNF